MCSNNTSAGFNNLGQLSVAAGAELHVNVGDYANAGTLAGDGTVRGQTPPTAARKRPVG